MSRKSQSITLSVSDRDKKELEKLALEFGLTWGDRPNISKLVEAIARQQLKIAPNNDWSNDLIKALDRARNSLIDLGEMGKAQKIAQLLRERSELTIPMRAEIESFLNHSTVAWRQKIDNYIHRQQPFRLHYQDAAYRDWTFTVLFARIQLIESREYLVCRCVETEGNLDIEQLCHNWSLRLDRITDAAIEKIDEVGLEDLERVEVEFRLYGGLAVGYRSKSNKDIFVGEIETQGSQRSRKVVRKIFSSYWFLREIAKYWEDCEIITPKELRDLAKDKAISLYQRYNLPTL